MGLTASPWGRGWRCHTAAQCRYQTARKYGLQNYLLKLQKYLLQQIVDGFFAKNRAIIMAYRMNYFYGHLEV